MCVIRVYCLYYAWLEISSDLSWRSQEKYRGADKSLARTTSRCILLVRIFLLMLVLLYIYIYTNSTNIPPIMIINRIYERQNLLSLQLSSFVVGLRTYQHHCKFFGYDIFPDQNYIQTTRKMSYILNFFISGNIFNILVLN